MLWVCVCIIVFRWARGCCAASVISGKLRVWSENCVGGKSRGDSSACGGGGKKKAKVLVLRAGVLRE